MSGSHAHRAPIPFAPVSILTRLEGAAVAVAAVVVFVLAGFAWWWMPALFLLFDLSFAGYAVSNRVGAFTYNLVHNYVVPVAMITAWGVALSAGQEWGVLVFVGACWLFHVGVDRALGFGPRPSE
ncbi:DUF4260 family protein [Microbacterium rhizomatis]|uniref:DUF4260 family protein n=1 Tax=Microbacterium rhizomatis TaxID=1631477 RepID=A0A5J5J084_9MICO|nr:DUF4260 family protein [Microbacterium rhizomatis]KAA9108062.1 DUF4260 family protein [Microbacterium rhizomatis]